MEAKSNKRGPRVPKVSKQYIMQDGTRLKVPLMMGNTPRMSGTRTGRDSEFLKSNNGKLSKLQHIIA